MFDSHTFLLIITVFVGLYMAWNIGANDVANAMGTSVGSKALTLKRAVIIAAILEFAGAFLVGSHVTDTVRKGIIDISFFLDTPNILMYGMIASLLAAAVWLQFATYFGLPVSTTHSIVGAIIGFALVSGGAQAVMWSKVGLIIMSWVVSPLLGGVISFLIFTLIKRKILNSPTPLQATQKIAPYLVFAVFFILTLVLLFKGLKQLNLDLSFINALQIATITGAVTGVISRFLIKKYLQHKQKKPRLIETNKQQVQLTEKLADIQGLLEQSSNIAAENIRWKVKKMKEMTSECLEDISKEASGKEEDGETFKTVEHIFIFLQILSACFVAFAHGANDVANAIGPMAAVISILKTGTVIMQVPVPLWVLAVGGLGIVVGLSTWGWRVIETIGKKITELTPTRGFSAEFGAATTIVIASKLGLPISTTHTLVGAVLGVGMARGVASLNLIVVRNILMSWFVTLPAGGILSILFFYILKAIF